MVHMLTRIFERWDKWDGPIKQKIANYALCTLHHLCLISKYKKIFNTWSSHLGVLSLTPYSISILFSSLSLSFSHLPCAYIILNILNINYTLNSRGVGVLDKTSLKYVVVSLPVSLCIKLLHDVMNNSYRTFVRHITTCLVPWEHTCMYISHESIKHLHCLTHSDNEIFLNYFFFLFRICPLPISCPWLNKNAFKCVLMTHSL